MHLLQQVVITSNNILCLCAFASMYAIFPLFPFRNTAESNVIYVIISQSRRTTAASNQITKKSVLSSGLKAPE